MKKIIVNENQKGLLFYGGKFAGLLNAGRYRVSGSKEIEIVSQDQPLYSRKCSLETLLSDRAVAEKLTVAEVADGALALHFVNGKFSDALTAGKYAFFSDIDKHEFQTVDLSSPEVGEDIPRYIFYHEEEAGERQEPWPMPEHMGLQEAVRRYEKGLIVRALEQSRTVTEAAEKLRLTRQALQYKMMKYHLNG